MLRMIPFSLMVTIIGFPFSFNSSPLPCCCFALTVIACCTLVYPSWCHMAWNAATAPFHRLHHGCSTLSCVVLWFPAESAHDAQCRTYHYVCSTTTCYQHSLLLQQLQAIRFGHLFPCLDLANYSVLDKVRVCFWGFKPFLDLEFFFCIFWTDVPAFATHPEMN